MVGVLPDFESDGASGDWPDDGVNVRGVKAIEKDKEAAILVREAAVQLNGKPVRLPAKEMIIVNCNTLTGHQLVRNERNGNI